MRVFKRFFIWSLAIFVVVGLGWRIWSSVFYQKPESTYTASGGPMDIKLIAMRPDMETDCYDVYGSRIDELPLEVLNANPTWNNPAQNCMEFIFEIPKETDIIFSDEFINVTSVNGANRRNNYLNSRMGNWRIVDRYGRKLLIVAMRFDGFNYEYGIFGGESVMCSHVDLRLIYNYPGNPSYVFTGPFKAGTEVVANNKASKLSVVGNVIDPGASVSAHFAGYGHFARNLAAYDKAGKLHRVTNPPGQQNFGIQTQRDCYVKGVPLSQIESIVCYNRSASRFYKNIKVEFDGHEKRYYAKYLDEMAKRLPSVTTYRSRNVNMQATAFASYQFKDWKEAVKVIDIKGGDVLKRATEKLISDGNFDISKVDPKTKKLIYETLIENIKSKNRPNLVRLGLKCRFNKFVDYALDTMEGIDNQYYGTNYKRKNYIVYFARELEKNKFELNADQQKRLQEIYKKTSNKHVKESLEKYIDK